MFPTIKLITYDNTFTYNGKRNLKNLTNYKVKENDVIDIVHPIYLDWLQDKNSPFRTHFYYFLPLPLDLGLSLASLASTPLLFDSVFPN